jgi:hypothetical protein
MIPMTQSRHGLRGTHTAIRARQRAVDESIPRASVDEHRIVLNRAGSIALSLISLRKELEIRSGGELSDLAADNLLNVCQVLGFAEPMIRFVLGEANL